MGLPRNSLKKILVIITIITIIVITIIISVMYNTGMANNIRFLSTSQRFLSSSLAITIFHVYTRLCLQLFMKFLIEFGSNKANLVNGFPLNNMKLTQFRCSDLIKIMIAITITKIICVRRFSIFAT